MTRLLALVVILTPQPLLAHLCAIEQVTDSTVGNSFGPSLSADGRFIAFESDADLVGTNADGNREIFLVDTTLDTTTQITDSTTLSGMASISADGSMIAFHSFANLTGGNPDGSAEVYVFHITTSTLTQITSSTLSSDSASVSGDASRLVFRSTADHAGGNADGSSEIFLFESATSTFTQLTDASAGSSESPVISDDGSAVAFPSTADLTGGNSDGSSEVFHLTLSTMTLVQVTDHAALPSFGPSLSTDGTLLTFVSFSDPTGENPTNLLQVFLNDVDAATFTQISTAFSGGGSIRGDGGVVVFNSLGDPSTNPEGNFEVFHFDIATSFTSQLTATSAGNNQPPAISRDGGVLAFESSADVTGGNPDGNVEMFRSAVCFLFADGFESGDTSSWSSAVP